MAVIGTIEKRNDCAEFEAKGNKYQCGDCQTDGHYLCEGCRHIASFDQMELSDNRERYYPDQEKKARKAYQLRGYMGAPIGN